MSLFTIADEIGDIKRFRDIAATIFEEGFPYLIEQGQLKWAVPIECRIRCFLKMCAGMWQKEPKEDLPVRLRRLLIKLGPTFIKFGQVLSLRPDLIPPKITQELSKLTDSVPPFPLKDVEGIIHDELKKPVSKLFKSFDEVPLAAASLAQVHKAILPNGQKVAVKIQRSRIRQLIEKDIHIMLYLAKIIEEKMPELKVYRPTLVVKEFAETIGRELDFSVEAIHAKRFEQMFEGDETVKVAHVFTEYSTKHILTMELIDGLKIDQVKQFAKKNIDSRVLAQNGVDAFLRQVFVEGFFHADPHPGNYFALPGSVFAFIDYGMVGRLNSDNRREMASLFISFINKDSESAIEHIKHLVEMSDESNISSFEHDIDDILHQWFNAKLREVSLAQTFFRIIDSGRKNRIYFPSSLVMLGKTLFTIEAMGFRLDPEFDFGKQMAPFIKNIVLSELSPQKLKQKTQDKALDYISYLGSLPEKTIRLLEKIDKGEVGVKINPEELRELEVRLSWEGYKKLIAIVIAATLFAFGTSYLVENKLLNLHISLGMFGTLFLLAILFFIFKR